MLRHWQFQWNATGIVYVLLHEYMKVAYLAMLMALLQMMYSNCSSAWLTSIYAREICDEFVADILSHGVSSINFKFYTQC